MKALRWVPLALLGGAAGALALLWERLPERWVTHWGLHGPDGWTTRTPTGACWLLGLGLAIWILIEAIVGLSRSRAKAPRELVEVSVTAARLVSIGVTALFAVLSLWLPLGHPQSSGAIVAVAFLIVGATVAAAGGLTQRRIRDLRRRGVPGLEGWSGFFYANRNDPRVWVPKALGVGMTLNFAHPRAWAWMATILAAPVIATVAALIATCR